LELKPDHSIAHYNLSTALYSLGELPAAVSSYRRALELNPDDARVHNNLGAALRSPGKLQKKPGDWSEVFERILAELKALAPANLAGD
jgi:Tfp pilus assembly protein PilF